MHLYYLNILGPAAIGFTVLAEAGSIGYDMLSEGKTFREAVGDSLFNGALGEKTKIDPQEELFKRFEGLGYDNEQMFRIKSLGHCKYNQYWNESWYGYS